MTGCLFEVTEDASQRSNDICLYSPANSSVFAYVWQKPCRFVKQNIELPVNGCCKFGETVYVDLNLKSGHLLNQITLKYTIPGIRHKSDKIHKSHVSKHHISIDDSETSHCVLEDDKSSKLPSHFVFWGNSIAHLLTEEVALLIDEFPIICHSGEWMEILDEYTTPINKSTDEIVGRHRKIQTLLKKSKQKQVRYAPLRLFFCESIEESLPLYNIDPVHCKLQLRIKIRDLQGCYYSSDNSIPYLIDSKNELSSEHIKLTVYANVYYITADEIRLKYGQGHRFLINQVEQYVQPIKKTNSLTNAFHSISLPFYNKPISQIIFAVQQECHLKYRDFFNWSGCNGDDPIEKMGFTVGGKTHFSERESKYFRTIIPMEHSPNIPKRHLYEISFALLPFRTNVITGSYTPPCSGDMKLNCRLQKNLGSSLFKAYCTTWNVVEITPERIMGTSF